MFIDLHVRMDACTFMCARVRAHTHTHTQFSGAAKYISALIPSSSSGN